MVVRDLDEHDPDPVRILDPHLDQPPGLSPRLPGDRDSGRDQTLTLGPHVADLQPDPKRSSRLAVGGTRHLQQSLAKEEDQSRIVRRPELAVDRQSEGVPVEPATALRVGRAYQDAAAQYLHGLDHRVARPSVPPGEPAGAAPPAAVLRPRYLMAKLPWHDRPSVDLGWIRSERLDQGGHDETQKWARGPGRHAMSLVIAG